MKRLPKTLPQQPEPQILDVALQAFAAVCQGDTAAADVYRVQTAVKEQDWRAIHDNLAELAAVNDPSELPQLLRSKLTSVVESLVMDHFYASLEMEDRELYAHLRSTERELADACQDLSTTHDFTFASVLEFVIFNGWASEDLTVDDFAALQKSFIDRCSALCSLELAIAKGRARGQNPSAAQSELRLELISRKEAAGRAFAGQA